MTKFEYDCAVAELKNLNRICEEEKKVLLEKLSQLDLKKITLKESEKKLNLDFISQFPKIYEYKGAILRLYDIDFDRNEIICLLGISNFHHFDLRTGKNVSNPNFILQSIDVQHVLEVYQESNLTGIL